MANGGFEKRMSVLMEARTFPAGVSSNCLDSLLWNGDSAQRTSAICSVETWCVRHARVGVVQRDGRHTV